MSKMTLRDEIEGRPKPQWHGTCDACGREYVNTVGKGQMRCVFCGFENACGVPSLHARIAIGQRRDRSFLEKKPCA